MIKRYFKFVIVSVFFVLTLLVSACNHSASASNSETLSFVQQNNTYPVDFFSEMHYSPAYRVHEPPSSNDVELIPRADAVEFISESAQTQDSTYNPDRAETLYNVNCSVCHGTSGNGDGPAASHMTASDSIYASRYGEAFKGPASLIEVRDRYTDTQDIGIDYVTTTISNGLCSTIPDSEDCIYVMPGFTNYISQEDIRDISQYIFDTESGLGSN